MTFYENWVEVMEMCTPEEWYELCKIITNLRFKGIDTDAKTISNLKIKMAWNLIRPSILKSNRDKRYNDTKRNGGNAEETKKSVITEVENNEFQIEENTADLSPSNDEEVEQPQPTRDNTAESIKIGNNEIIEDNTCMERKPLIKIAASKQSSNMERLQNIINTDDDFYKVYNNCIKAVVEYELSNGDLIKANSKDMAMQKLKNLCNSYQIPYNEETHNFILKDVNYSISNMGSYSVA
jgi:hypothetical protein